MKYRCIVLLPVMLIAAVVAVMLYISNMRSAAIQSRLLYIHMEPIRDGERRCDPLKRKQDDTFVDMTAFVGMPGVYSNLVSAYVQDTFFAIEAAPLTRPRYYHQYVPDPKSEYVLDMYPDIINPVRDRDAIVPLVILPRPEAVRQWSSSTRASAWGWRAESHVKQSRGSVYGRTLVFEPGKLSREPNSLPASPLESGIAEWDVYLEELGGGFLLELGKLVDWPHYDIPPSYALIDRSAELHLGEEDGGKRLGEIFTTPPFLKNSRLRWVSVQNGSISRTFLAYALVDGNGAKRAKRFQDTNSGPISPFVRPLICEPHQPRIKQHDELLLPTPLGWAPIMQESVSDFAHEEWCLDDWFPAQADACWVIREAEDSKPLQESFLLMPAREPSDRPVFFTALFAETEPKQLIQELAALYQVSPDKALNSPETMQRLQSLYERVRDFPLSK